MQSPLNSPLRETEITPLSSSRIPMSDSLGDGPPQPPVNTDDLLPITQSRNAKWWYSTFHNVTAMVGAGVLSFPVAMKYLGWAGGTIALAASWIITLFTLWQLVEMHENADTGHRFSRYHELGQAAFGPKLGLWIVVPQQIIVEVTTNIVYMVTGGEALQQFYWLVKCQKTLRTEEYNDKYACDGIGVSSWILIFSSQHFFLSQLPNFNAIAFVSLAAAVMSLSYSTIAWTATVHEGRQFHPVDYGHPERHPDGSRAHLVFGAFEALGVIAFAYAGHNVVLEIQATLPSNPPKNPSKIAMWRGAVLAYIVVALCYIPVAISGYWAFGNKFHDRKSGILTVLFKPRWLIATANLMVVLHVTGSYQVYAMPLFDQLESLLVVKFHIPPSLRMRILTRSSYVFFTAFVAVSFPFFNALVGFVGGFALAPTTYFLPCICWLRIKRPRPYSRSWIINWFLIFVGVILMLVATTGGFWNIVQTASHYHFYQFRVNGSSTPSPSPSPSPLSPLSLG